MRAASLVAALLHAPLAARLEAMPRGQAAPPAPATSSNAAPGPMPRAPEPSVVPDAFPDATLDRWQEREFAGRTDYALVEEDGARVLRGHARGTASILYREAEIDLGATPVLEWSWKVDRVYEMIDERARAGDDFPARLYVVVRTGFLPWETIAINYVWASTASPGESWPNPYTDKAVMIAVRGGPDEVGRWVRERRDVAADFRAAFGERVERIDGYAIMVDGDNGDREAIAWFGELGFAPRAAVPTVAPSAPKTF